MRKQELSLLFGLVCSLIVSSVAAFAGQCDQVRSDVLRLHILADSDSPADQEIKLRVRDAVLRDTQELFAQAASLEQAQQLAEAALPRIERSAAAELQRLGCEDPVTVSLERAYFSTRVYERFTLPAGEYEAVRVVIGSGGGRNWWCVMYPQLCLPASCPRADRFTAGELAVIGASVGYEPRFAVVEWLEGMRAHREV